jgi:hypothetical protein
MTTAIHPALSSRDEVIAHHLTALHARYSRSVGDNKPGVAMLVVAHELALLRDESAALRVTFERVLQSVGEDVERVADQVGDSAGGLGDMAGCIRSLVDVLCRLDHGQSQLITLAGEVVNHVTESRS